MNSKPSLSRHHDESERLIAAVGPGAGLAFVAAYFPAAKTIRIASAYFSLSGYKIGREHTSPDVQFHVLVGREDGKNVRNAVIDEIQAELQSCETNLWQAVGDLVFRMEAGRFVIRDARSMLVPFHCKFFICDDVVMWHGSANYSENGLTKNAEQGTASFSPDELSLFTSWYDAVAATAHDLLAKLLELLKQWLELASPFDAYLKVLLVLSSLPDRKIGPEAHVPTYYQRAVVARALVQIKEYGGALIVLATGLGKTIVGAELAHQLHHSDETEHTILLTPNAVREAWQVEMDGRDLLTWYFPTDILFRPDSRKQHHQISKVVKRLQHAGERTLIIIDEAHFYRNQLLSQKQNERPSLVYLRLLPAVRAGAKIVLLTATAYGTSINNFESLLHLLPHRQKTGLLEVPGPWQAKDPDEFRRLPMVTILGLPDVLGLARRRGDVDLNERPFFPFRSEHRYLPNVVKLVPVFYELPLQDSLRNAFDEFHFSHSFRVRQIVYDDDIGEYETASNAGYNAALNSWLSSPPAMKAVIDFNLETEDKSEQLALMADTRPEANPKRDAPQVADTQLELLSSVSGLRSDGSRGWGHSKKQSPYSLQYEVRKSVLQPLSELLDATPDHKLHELLRIVRNCSTEQNRKVLIFVRMHRTALYVENHLHRNFQHLKVACTVEESRGKPNLKSRPARDEILRRFSPKAYNVQAEEEVDILICTDADGVGVNLQDADVVINYDPPSGADVLFQRAGRVLRMTTRSDRAVKIYTFIPAVIREAIDSEVCLNIKERFSRLSRRHEKSRELHGSTVYSSSEILDLMEERTVDVEDWFRVGDLASSFGAGEETSFAKHMSLLEEYRERAERLPQPLHAARITRSFADPHVVVLFEIDRTFQLILFSPHKDRTEGADPWNVLDLLRCEPGEQYAPVMPAEIERTANRAVQVWCAEHNIEVSHAKKICAVYLQPPSEVPVHHQLLMHL